MNSGVICLCNADKGGVPGINDASCCDAQGDAGQHCKVAPLVCVTTDCCRLSYA